MEEISSFINIYNDNNNKPQKIIKNSNTRPDEVNNGTNNNILNNDTEIFRPIANTRDHILIKSISSIPPPSTYHQLPPTHHQKYSPLSSLNQYRPPSYQPHPSAIIPNQINNMLEQGHLCLPVTSIPLASFTQYSQAHQPSHINTMNTNGNGNLNMHTNISIGGTTASRSAKKNNYKCPHGRQKSKCRDCNGTGICEHNKIKTYCKLCSGAGLCEHKKQKSRCKECGGKSICPHNMIRMFCKSCKGSQVCQHENIRNRCRDCGGKALCEHSNIRRDCKICKSTIICEHLIPKVTCEECRNNSLCEHKKNATKCKECKTKKILVSSSSSSSSSSSNSNHQSNV